MPGTKVKALLLDLDGTLLDTESLVLSVAKKVVADHYSANLTCEACKASLGKRPIEAWASVISALQLREPAQDGEQEGPLASAQKLLDLSEPLLQEKWCEARMLPGAMRLLRYLAHHNIPYAIATSTPRSTLNAKTATKEELKELVKVAVCGDEVANGKPSPDTFIEAARKLGLTEEDFKDCLVIEDALSGVQAGVAAGMQVLYIPSIRDQCSCELSGVKVKSSLMDFEPEEYGLPSFKDTVEGTTPLDPPLQIKGEVVKGFGRGSKELGIPTANISPEALVDRLADAVTGIYCGWASLGDSDEVHKMVMSIGYNPFYGNTHKTAEPWILSDFDQPFYGKELRLLVAAYIRPECNFTSLQALVDRIHEDARVSKVALDDHRYQDLRCDAWLRPT